MTANCDTPRVPRDARGIEQVIFTGDDLARVTGFMARLAKAEEGWINVLAHTSDDDEQPTSLGFFKLLGGGSIGLTMCTWVPGTRSRRGPVRPSLGISHLAGRRAAALLHSLAIPVPEGWLIEQDHPRRGLVLRLPPEQSHEHVLVWSLQAVAALSPPGPIGRWRADVYLPLKA